VHSFHLAWFTVSVQVVPPRNLALSVDLGFQSKTVGIVLHVSYGGAGRRVSGVDSV